jgi:hypothetical protein
MGAQRGIRIAGKNKMQSKYADTTTINAVMATCVCVCVCVPMYTCFSILRN